MQAPRAAASAKGRWGRVNGRLGTRTKWLTVAGTGAGTALEENSYYKTSIDIVQVKPKLFISFRVLTNDLFISNLFASSGSFFQDF